MRKLFPLVVLILLAAWPVRAQFTLVSGTVVDPNGLAYSNGTIQAQLTPTGGSPKINNQPFTTFVSTGMDVNGHFSMNLADNTQVTPSGTHWQFTVSGTAGVPPPIGTGTQTFVVGNVSISGISQDISSILNASATVLANISGGGGGGANPCNLTANSIQKNNDATHFGCAQELDLGSPRGVAAIGISPHVNVAAYGAVGDGSTDDTTAIQNAVSFGCAHNGATIYFPPPTNFYKVIQPQTGTNAVFNTTGCNNLTLVGGSAGNQRIQFGAPSVAIVVSPGATPNPGPIFDLTNLVQTGVQNLGLYGYNEGIVTGTNAWLFNVNASAVVTAIGTSAQPNTGAVIPSGLWTHWIGGTAAVHGVTTQFAVTILQNNPGQPPGIITMEDMTLIGCIHAHSITSQTGTAGNWHFNSVTAEDCATGYMVIDDDGVGGHNWTVINGITFTDSDISDANYSAYLTLNSAGSIVKAVRIRQAGGFPTGTQAISQLAGSIQNWVVDDPPTSWGQVVDASGNIIGGGNINNGSGQDYFSNGGIAKSTNIDGGKNIGGPAMRGFNAGTSPQNSFATILSDPIVGWCVSRSSTFGPDACAQNDNSIGSWDFTFPTAYAPTSVAGTGTTGGTLALGSYRYFVAAATSASCATISAPSLASGIVVVSGGNNAVNLTWTLPAIAGSGTTTGFCVIRGPGTATSEWNSQQQYFTQFVSGASTASYTDTGFAGCCLVAPPVATTYSATHRFTPNSLAVNSTNNHGFNFYVNGTGEVDGNFTVTGTCTGCGAGTAFQVNGTPLAGSPSTVDFINSAAFNGVTFTFTDAGGGQVQLGASGTLGNAGLTNPQTTVNGQTCTLGSVCTIPFQFNSTPNISQQGLNLLSSSANAHGLTAVISNPGTNQDQVEVGGVLNPAGGGCGTANPTAHTLSVNEGSSVCNQIGPGLTGQVYQSFNAADPAPVSPGLAGRVVSIGTDPILCDSATTILDRMHTVEYTNATSTAVTMPDAGSSGCGSNFAVKLFAGPSAGNVTVSRTSTSTFTVLNGSTALSAQTSFSFSVGESVLVYSPDNSNWVAIISVGANTGATSFPVTVTGVVNSGGIPCFNSAANEQTSTVLSAGGLVVGGGAAACPTTGNADFTYLTHTLAAGAAGIIDFSPANAANATKPMGVGAGLTAGANGVLAYNTTDTNTHTRTNGADSIVAAEAAAFAAGFFPKQVDATHGLFAASLCDEAITTANAFTCTDTAGMRSPSFTSTGTTAGFADYPQGSTSAAVAPCNTANSICEQAPAAVTSYVLNKPGAAPVNNNSASTCSNASPSVCAFAKMPQTAITSGSAYTNATTTFSSVVGGSGQTLQFSVEASTNYVLVCKILWSASVATAGPKFQFTGPASPTAVQYSVMQAVLATSEGNAGAVAFSTSINASGTTVVATTNEPAMLNLGLVNGANAGTVTLQAAAQGSGTLTIQPGSYCTLQ